MLFWFIRGRFWKQDGRVIVKYLKCCGRLTFGCNSALLLEQNESHKNPFYRIRNHVLLHIEFAILISVFLYLHLHYWSDCWSAYGGLATSVHCLPSGCREYVSDMSARQQPSWNLLYYCTAYNVSSGTAFGCPCWLAEKCLWHNGNGSNRKRRINMSDWYYCCPEHTFDTSGMSRDAKSGRYGGYTCAILSKDLDHALIRTNTVSTELLGLC